jgi:ABC-type amino acid transport substrate-binding protein
MYYCNAPPPSLWFDIEFGFPLHYILKKATSNRLLFLKGMSMQGKRVLVVLISLCVLSLIAYGEGIGATLQDIKARGKLIAGVKTDFPPFGFMDETGTHKGFDIDLAKVLARELFGNAEAVEFVAVTTEDRISILNSRRVDILAATMTITEERKKVVDFSIPYFMSGQLILVPKKSKILRYGDLAGKRVATVLGSTGDTAIRKLVPTAIRIQLKGTAEALQALKDGRVEAFVQDDVLLIEIEKKNPEVKIADWKPFETAPYGLAVRKGDREWLEFVNATLRKMKTSGDYKKLLEKWFGEVRAFLINLE